MALKCKSINNTYNSSAYSHNSQMIQNDKGITNTYKKALSGITKFPIARPQQGRLKLSDSRSLCQSVGNGLELKADSLAGAPPKPY
ncbi:hypothetical protein PoB_005150400 [Plakobranchus ocellatus]|uniref:Uncharacterized protein n=1 Tax=Plakobranchus ocellatus TaxID=259542 RepID=A0AAV4C1K3_9GAST|nr:hypothetical protein PoB_005150400 [Plakobranchus ocellatus]